MEIQDQTGIINPNPPSVPGNQMQVDVRTSSANGGDKHNILKVRKPYTITKHRERWAEEEHKKFLEALQLYGRVWRRIEEHIGTKTAVQIRSRAQKFFSKVVRKSDADSTGNVKPIEIPPPRSKRKPAHPYPRKSGNTCSSVGLSISKLERSFSPVKSAFEGENGSPTSVLFGFGSDTLGSLLSNVQNSCTSPVTSAAGSNGQETSVEEENNLPLSRHDQSVMELDTSSKGSVPPKEASLLEEEQVPCLKLFGKTVMMTDKPKPSSPGAGDTTQDPNSLPTLSIGIQGRSAPSQNFAQGSVPGDFPPWSGIVLPMLYPLSWWGMCENSPQFPFIHHQEEISRRVTRRPSAEVPADKEGQRECCSWTGSNTTSASDGQSAAKDDSTAMQSTRAGSDASARGFASYKRCVAETEVQQDSRRCWKSESPIPRSNTTCWASKFTKSRLDFNRRMANDGEGQSVSVGLCL